MQVKGVYVNIICNIVQIVDILAFNKALTILNIN